MSTSAMRGQIMTNGNGGPANVKPPTVVSMTPQWEDRNRGFVNPIQLRQQNSSVNSLNNNNHNPVNRSPLALTAQGSGSSQQQQQQQQQPNPNTNMNMSDQHLPRPRPRPASSAGKNSNTHSRTSSIFSFRKNSNPTKPQLGLVGPSGTPPKAGSRPGSAGGNAPPNEFGGIQQHQRSTTYSTYSEGPTPPEKPAQQVQLQLQQQPHQQQQQQQQPPAHQLPPQPASPTLHPEIRSIVSLKLAHACKVYFSGPLVKRVERLADGSHPAKDEGWTEVWAQLGGTTLSVWDMKKIAEANKQGREIPPAYINMTDAFIQVLGSVTMPATATVPLQQFTNVLTLNTAGSNLLLFSCPSTAALISWAAALRLSAWEKSRLEEIYTAHLLRITIPEASNAPSTLVKGRMEGWVRIRLAGHTDWKRFYMVVSSGSSNQALALTRTTSVSDSPQRNSRRISNLFSREPPSSAPLPPKPMVALYSGSKIKDRKAPVLTMREITQAFSVYPEKPELINKSTLIKLEGLMGDEVSAGVMRNREAWMMVMPELGEGSTQAGEMLKWITAFHDAFELYGRPRSYTWDPRDPASLMFGYPVGPKKDLLFLEREVTEALDPRDDRTSIIRSRFVNILLDKMRTFKSPVQPAQPVSTNGAPSLPPTLNLGSPQQQQQPHQQQGGQQQQNGHTDGTAPQLPSFDFGASNNRSQNRGAGSLTPITERTLESVDVRNSRSLSLEKSSPQGRSHSGDQNLVARTSLQGGPSTVVEESQDNNSMFGIPISRSPPPHVPDRRSEDSSSAAPPSSLSPSSLNTGPSKTSGEATSNSGDIGSGKSLPSPPATRSPTSPGPSVTSTSPVSSPKVSLDKTSSRIPQVTQPVESPLSAATTSPHSAVSPTAEGSSTPHVPVLTSPHSIVSSAGTSQSLTSPPSARSSKSPPRLASPQPQTITETNLSTSKYPVMTSPYPPIDASRQKDLPSRDSFSVPDSKIQPTPPPPPTPNTAGPLSAISPSTEDSPQSLFDEAGALYYMQQFEDEGAQKNTVGGPRRIPTTISEGTDESTDDSTPNNMSPGKRSPATQIGSTQSIPMRRGTPGLLDRQMTNASVASSGMGGIESMLGSPVTAHSVIGRKPSGARVPPASRKISASQKRVSDEDSQSDSIPQSMSSQHALVTANTSVDDNADALAALSFLDQDQPPVVTTPTKVAVLSPPPPPPPALPVVQAPSPPPANSEGAAQYKSSFAPSKQAAVRKAKLQAQEAASHAAAHKPGRANGKQKSTARDRGAWNQSSDEEEEEDDDDDDDDDDADSDEPRSRVPPPVSPIPAPAPVRPLHLRARDISPNGAPMTELNAYTQSRQSRNLPPIPGGRPVDAEDFHNYHNVPPSRRVPSDQYSEAPTRSYNDPGQHVRAASDFLQPDAARQNIWSQALNPGQNAVDLPNSNRDTFVQLESPSQTMTKAFTPHGLLSAGLQDKQDRSAKKQEEIARESGASLINVPNKPPPPQTGLLGAITAHERERKREGGVGAALTEREREKRVTEEKQRKLDEFQRQQLELMQNGGGSMYQHPQFTGYNPMMGNPMMMPMNPMMTGMNPMMGYPGMMPGFANPQHMFAAQQAAAQAYQQAMVAFSVAGSQVGGEGEGGQGAIGGAGASPINPMHPMMTGGGMSMYDPRMSMMGMPMMGSPYMGGMGGQPGMQYPGVMGGQVPNMNMMGMQMTGGSAFDPRLSPGAIDNGGLQPPAHFQGQILGPPSRNSSPAAGASPASPATRPSSGRSSPRPPPQ